MPDQLSLRLELTSPRLPATIRPMMPQPVLEAFDSPDHLFEPSWGGTRILAFIEPAAAGPERTLRLLDERGRDVAALLPELAPLVDRIAAESAVLDGEIVVVDRLGRSDRLALAARLRGRPGPPVAYLVFDVVHRDGRPLFTTPLERRREILRRLLLPGEEAIAVPSIAGEGRALHAAVAEAGIAGVMGRARRSPYLPGVRSSLWRFAPRRVSEEAAAAEAGAADGEETEIPAEGAATDDDGSPRNAPMLALIRRLPLDESDA